MTSLLSEKQYDIIFAGGGTCSCIAASRLLNADPDLRILIIEYGPDTKNDLRHMQPAQAVVGVRLRRVRWPRYVDNTTGTRSDVPHHYIYNNTNNPNLTILTRCIVDSVIIENGRAVGVKYQSFANTGTDSQSTVQECTPQTHCIRATKMVVLGAGAFGSPAILERSGISSHEILQKCGIPQLVDLPGVGGNYMDHWMVYTTYHATQDIESLDDIFFGSQDQYKEHLEVWSETRTGLMTHNAIDAGIKIRPNEEELQAMPGLAERWNTYFARAPDKPLACIWTMAAHGETPAPASPLMSVKRYFSIGYFLAYPASTGYTHITSRDPRAKEDHHMGMLENPADLPPLRWVYKKTRELARRMGCYRGEAAHGHPSFALQSDAAVLSDDMPHRGDQCDIVYTNEDDARIDEFIRRSVDSMAHPCGTCAMKPRDKGGVVDERLNVYGILGLKVADCSIFPSNVGANLYSTAIAIGEKAAVIIADDLGFNI